MLDIRVIMLLYTNQYKISNSLRSFDMLHIKNFNSQCSFRFLLELTINKRHMGQERSESRYPSRDSGTGHRRTDPYNNAIEAR